MQSLNGFDYSPVGSFDRKLFFLEGLPRSIFLLRSSKEVYSKCFNSRFPFSMANALNHILHHQTRLALSDKPCIA